MALFGAAKDSLRRAGRLLGLIKGKFRSGGLKTVRNSHLRNLTLGAGLAVVTKGVRDRRNKKKSKRQRPVQIFFIQQAKVVSRQIRKKA